MTIKTDSQAMEALRPRPDLFAPELGFTATELL
jgi:hypothetical protein